MVFLECMMVVSAAYSASICSVPLWPTNRGDPLGMGGAAPCPEGIM